MENTSTLKTELPYDSAISLLNMYPQKTRIWKDTCTPMLTAALFTIGKTHKQAKCPPTGKWIKMWYIHMYSAIKKEWYSAISSNMNGPRNYHTKWSQKKTRNPIWYCLYVKWKKKIIQMNLLQNRYRICLPMKKTWVQFLGQEDPLDRGAWRATDHGLHGVGHDWELNHHHIWNR